MITSLNLTLQLKQDEETQKTVKALQEGLFAEKFQPAIDKALGDYDRVHFARVVVIENENIYQYIQVLTVFNGDRRTYTDFFLKELPDVFEAIFSLADGAPPWEELGSDPELFYEYSREANIKPLGNSLYAGNDDGYVFMAQGEMEVAEIREAIELTDNMKGIRDFLQS